MTPNYRVVVFPELTCKNLDALEVISQLEDRGYTCSSGKLFNVCPTTATVLGLKNRPDGTWKNPNTKVYAVKVTGELDKLEDEMKSIWEKDPQRKITYPVWADPYILTLPKQTLVFALSLGLDRNCDDRA